MSDVDGCKVVNVRRWRVINDVLYVTVGITHPTTGKKIGALLRWYGDKKDPWNFHIVGLVDNEAAELAYFNNRIYRYVGNSIFRACQSGTSKRRFHSRWY